MWHGLVVCPQLYMCAPWGKALLPSGSWFPYQTQRVSLDRVYMSFSYFKVLSQCKFTNIYTHTFYLLYKQTTGQKTGIWVIWIPNTTLIFQNYSLPSNQVKPDSFSWLSRSYYHLPNCRFNFITNSPAPQPTVLFTVPRLLPPLSHLLLFMLFLNCHPYPLSTLPVPVVGGWWEASQILPADHMHVSCHQGCDALGDRYMSALSVSPQGPAFQFWVHLEVLFCFAIGKGPEVKGLA